MGNMQWVPDKARRALIKRRNHIETELLPNWYARAYEEAFNPQRWQAIMATVRALQDERDAINKQLAEG